MLRRQCEIQSRKENDSELTNMSEFADVSSESSSSERLLVHRLLVVALMKSFRSKRQQIHSYLAVHYHSVFDFITFLVCYGQQNEYKLLFRQKLSCVYA